MTESIVTSMKKKRRVDTEGEPQRFLLCNRAGASSLGEVLAYS